MKKYFMVCDNSVLLEKKQKVESKILALDDVPSPDAVSRAMVVSALINEMEDSNV